VWIPAVAAGIAAIESLHHFDATAARLAGANSSLTQLKNLRIWWQSLSLTQQSLPHNKQELVEVTEDAIQDELAAWTSGASNHRTGFYLPAVLSPVLASFLFRPFAVWRPACMPSVPTSLHIPFALSVFFRWAMV
jgi:hypothetical protein